MMHKSYPFVGHLVTNAKELPVSPPVAFLGREELLMAVKRQLDTSGVVLLHGPDGVGKTTIATVLTALLASEQAGGVWVNTGHDDIGTLCDQIGQAFDERSIIDTPGLEAQLDRTRTLLNAHRPLIVLDNVANAQAAREFIREVASGLPVLLTATDKPRGPWMPVAVEALERQTSVSLFYKQSGLTPSNHINDIAALCDQLENRPLAVEIAARLVAAASNVTPGALLGALPSRYDLPPGADMVQAILRVVLGQLPPGEQALFMVLGGTFAGGGTPTLLTSIADLKPVYVEKAINRLETRGLVRTAAAGPHMCVTMHGAIYRFARDLLSSMGRLASAEARTVQAVTAYTDEHNDDIALRAEWGNILGALAWAARAGNAADVSAIAAAVANSALLTINGHARLRQQLALASAGGGELAPAVAPTDALLSPAAVDWPGRELVEEGDQSIAAGNPEAAIASYSQALQMAQQAGDVLMAGRVLAQLGEASNLLAQHEQAAECYRQAIENAQKAQDSVTQNVALTNLGATLMAMGQLDEAVSVCRRAISVLEGTGQNALLAHTYHGLGQVLAEQRHLDQATETHQQAVELAHEAGDRQSEAAYLNDLALVFIWHGKRSEAIETYEQAIAIARDIDAYADEAVYLNNLSMVYMDLGEAEVAQSYCEQALGISRDLGDREQEANVLGNLGVAYGVMDRWEEALECHNEALEISRAAGNLRAQSHHLGNIGQIQQKFGARDEAIRAYRYALNIAYRLDDEEGQAVWLYHLGSLMMDEVPHLAEAVSMLREAYAIQMGREHPMAEETHRRLNRAQKRLERAQKAGLEILPPPTAEQRRAAANPNRGRPAEEPPLDLPA